MSKKPSLPVPAQQATDEVMRREFVLLTGIGPARGPVDPWPFRIHRTMAEVTRDERKGGAA